MSSVASTASNSGLAYLTQLLSGPSSPLLSSGMSSSQVQSVLQSSSPSDIVQISDQALQLQNLDTLFGTPDNSGSDGLFSTPTTPDSSAMLANAVSSLTASDSATPSISSQIASYQIQAQTESMQTLLGIDPSSGITGNTLNLFA